MRVFEPDSVEKTAEKNRRLMFAAMRRAGVAYAVVQFDGSGDSGQIENVACFDAAGDPIDVDTVLVDGGRTINHTGFDGKQEYVEYDDETPTLPRIIDEFCYRALENTHGGWEINEGSFGDFRISAKEESVSLEFNQRFEDYETSHEEF